MANPFMDNGRLQRNTAIRACMKSEAVKEMTGFQDSHEGSRGGGVI